MDFPAKGKARGISRREILKSCAIAAAGAALPGTIGAATALADSRRQTAPLPRPKFYWGVGIENCWMAQTDPKKDGNRRLLDVFLQMQHYEKWKADLDLVKEVGFNAIRYSVPWYKAEPKPGVYDWSWIDKPVEYLVEKLKIVPIMDLIHYGTPAWMADGVIDERFPEAIGRYAGRDGGPFQGAGEPLLAAQRAGAHLPVLRAGGRWPPYQRTIESWAKIGVRVAKGMVLETAAIRQALPDAVIVSVDPFFYGVVDRALPPAPATMRCAAQLLRAAASYPASLAYGKVAADHPFADFLRKHGVSEAEWPGSTGRCSKARHPRLQLLSRVDWKRRAAGKPPSADASGAKDAADRSRRAVLETQTYFDLPVYLTETSTGDTDDAKIAYINALGRNGQELHRAEGTPGRSELVAVVRDHPVGLPR